MILFPRLGPWRKLSTATTVPLALFAVLLVHGALLGLTDDEAYYWVLAQRPALGYAFHPPAVAWLIMLSQMFFGEFLGYHSSAVVRLPAAALSAFTLALSLRWMRAAGASEPALDRAALGLLSFAGLFALSWMTVPDLPLIFGLVLAFSSAWHLCFMKPSAQDYWGLGFGCLVAILSKYSGILVPFSAAWCLISFASESVRRKGIRLIVISSVLAAVPILIWNQQHAWASILYQVRDRHGSLSLSFTRWARFWLIEIVAAGPPLIYYAFGLPRRAQDANLFRRRVPRFIACWVYPPAVIFLIQPLFSEFKPHWALVVWLPIALELALRYSREPRWTLGKWQTHYGIVLGAFVLISCHVAIFPRLFQQFTGQALEPKLDVTNDLYGWGEFSEVVSSEALLPIVGSRYQTASQAAFALGDVGRVSLIPRDRKQMDEWSGLGVTDTQGPEWPRLIAPVLFVGDNRYSAPPAFEGATCEPWPPYERDRGPYKAKTLLIWRCDPT